MEQKVILEDGGYYWIMPNGKHGDTEKVIGYWSDNTWWVPGGDEGYDNKDVTILSDKIPEP